MQTDTTNKNKTHDSASTAQPETTYQPRVVIVGAGFGGLQAAKSLAKAPVKVTVIDTNNFHLFQPMLYQVATAGLSPADIASPVRQILQHQSNTEVLMAEVTGVHVDEQRVLMGEQSLPYDYLLLATGATSNYFGHDEWQKLAPSLKSIDDAIVVRDKVLLAFEAAEREPDEEKRKALLTFVLVGGGPTGVELAGAVAELTHQALAGQFRHIRPDSARIILVEGKNRIMPSFPASLTKKARAKLNAMGVEIRSGVHVKSVKSDGVMIGDQHVATENVIWTAGVKASPAGQWLKVQTDHDGRVKVQADMTVPGHKNIFALGDTALALQNGKPLPGLAPVAIQEAKYVASVIEDHAAHKEHPRPFHYFDKGTMATVGRSFGVVDIGFLHFTGFFAWLTWLFVHILFLLGARNRLSVLFQYAWSYFTYQRGVRVILPQHNTKPPA
ncbi:MAG: NAD(P)/FAD-dependent oxidoreductase [Ktedonobacteraceae bacterium]